MLTGALQKLDQTLQGNLLSVIQKSSAKYSGELTPEKLYGCQLVAASLKDQFDTERLELINHEELSYDYFGVIAREKGTLLALGESWILAGISKYIKEDMTYQMTRPIRSREMMASLQGSGWNSVSDPSGKQFNLKDLTIYALGSQLMIFAPISLNEAKKVFLYLNRNMKLYESNVYLVIKDLPLKTALDLKYLYPLEIEFAGNYLIFSTDKMTLSQLERIYYFGEVEFPFPRLDELRGAYGAYLLSEALFYQFSIRWEDRKLYVGLAGYIQAVDISEQFGQILVEVNQEVDQFVKLPDYRSAAEYCQNSNTKGFYYLGDYYVAIGSKSTSDVSSVQFKEISELEQIESMDPMRGVIHPVLAQVTKEYLKQLGYIISSGPERFYVEINLGYRTYEIPGEISTLYYYKSTNGVESEIYETRGFYREEVKNQLEGLLRTGHFFTQRVKNLIRGYPRFIPGDAPIQRTINED